MIGPDKFFFCRMIAERLTLLEILYPLIAVRTHQQENQFADIVKQPTHECLLRIVVSGSNGYSTCGHAALGGVLP